MVYVTAIHQQGGYGHEHSTSVRQRDPADGKTGQSSKAETTDWIKNQKRDARATGVINPVEVGVVNASPLYIHSYGDGKVLGGTA